MTVRGISGPEAMAEGFHVSYPVGSICGMDFMVNRFGGRGSNPHLRSWVGVLFGAPV